MKRLGHLAAELMRLAAPFLSGDMAQSIARIDPIVGTDLRTQGLYVS